MEEYEKTEIRVFTSRYRICGECNGAGWTHETGCDGCPVQEGCNLCEGLGFIPIDKPFKKVISDIESEDIPF